MVFNVLYFHEYTVHLILLYYLFFSYLFTGHLDRNKGKEGYLSNCLWEFTRVSTDIFLYFQSRLG